MVALFCIPKIILKSALILAWKNFRGLCYKYDGVYYRIGITSINTAINR
jgi:hypothetical protein